MLRYELPVRTRLVDSYHNIDVSGIALDAALSFDDARPNSLVGPERYLSQLPGSNQAVTLAKGPAL